MKIVTIDFDIIMRPSIESYNYFINEEGCGIDQLEEEFVQFQNCQADLSIYKLLTDFILNVESEKIFFISSHKDILQFVNDSVDLINIDHHHDLGYSNESYSEAFEISCGNWVEQLYREDKLKSYTWIHNQNSLPLIGDQAKIDNDLILSDENEMKKYLNNLAQHTDSLIICSSFPWVPSIYRPLFNTWHSICENKVQKKIDIL